MSATNGEAILNFAPSNVTGDCSTLRATFVALCLTLFATFPLYGQSGSAPASQGAASYGAAALANANLSGLQSQNPYLGGVPTGTVGSTSLSLSLEDAVARGLKQNLILFQTASYGVFQG